MTDADATYEFGPYRLDCARRVLLRDGELLALPPRQLDILVVLVQQHGELVEKDELMRRVWGGTVVEDGNLPVNVHALRKALSGDDVTGDTSEGERAERSERDERGERGEGERYIQTVPRRGYRFVAPVLRVDKTPPSRRVDEAPPSRRVDDRLPRTVDPASPVRQMDAPAMPDAAPLVASGGTLSSAWRRRVPLALVALAFAGFVAAAAWMRPRPESAASPNLGAIAVLPFAATRNGTPDEALGWGLADGVTAQLARQREVLVRPGVATIKFPGGKTDALEAGRALQVEAVVQGSVRAEGTGLRVWAQLVRVADGTRLWGLADEGRGYAALDQAQRDLAAALAGAIGARGVVVDVPASSTVPRNPVAEELLLKGRHLCSHASPVKSAQGLAQLEQATALDPTLAPAHTAIATCLVAPVAGSPNEEKMSRARAAAQRALQLDERQAAAHAALAFSGIYSAWDWAGARRHFERAVELSPQDLHTHLWSAMAHTAMAQHDQALEELRTARRIDPSSSRAHITHGYALYMARRFDQAVEVLLKAPLELGPANHQVLWGLGLAHVQRGDRAEAFHSLQGALTRTGNHPAAKAYLAYAHARFGEAREARALLAEIGDVPAAPPVLVAPAHACLGDRDRAFELLEAALVRRDYRLIYLGVDPMFDCLRSDPRLPAMTRRLGLAGP